MGRSHFSFSVGCTELFIFNMSSTNKQPVRLYVNGAILGYQRGLRTQNNSCSLIKIKGVDLKEEVDFYLGKRVAFITKCSTAAKNGSKFRVNWGRVCRAHGTNGVVRCRFRRDLPPQAMGGRVRVMLYPSRV